MEKIAKSTDYIRDKERLIVVTTIVEENQFDDVQVKLFSYETEEFVKRGQTFE